MAGSPFSHSWAGVSYPSTQATKNSNHFHSYTHSLSLLLCKLSSRSPEPVVCLYNQRWTFCLHLAASCYILARAHVGLCRCPVPVPCWCRRLLVQLDVCAQSFALQLGREVVRVRHPRHLGLRVLRLAFRSVVCHSAPYSSSGEAHTSGGDFCCYQTGRTTPSPSPSPSLSLSLSPSLLLLLLHLPDWSHDHNNGIDGNNNSCGEMDHTVSQSRPQTLTLNPKT